MSSFTTSPQPPSPARHLSAFLSVLMQCSEWFELLLNWTALSSCVFSAPPPSEPGRRWLRSDPQQQILCLQDCTQRQLLRLLCQWQEGHVQGGRGSAPQPWHWPGPQQIFNLTGNCVFVPPLLFLNYFYFIFLKILLSYFIPSRFLRPCVLDYTSLFSWCQIFYFF